MRWDALTTDTAEDQQPLPGYGDDAVVRRFDAPEALDMRFYEVHARSVLNRVAAGAQVPFVWTVNPYPEFRSSRDSWARLRLEFPCGMGVSGVGAAPRVDFA